MCSSLFGCSSLWRKGRDKQSYQTTNSGPNPLLIPVHEVLKGQQDLQLQPLLVIHELLEDLRAQVQLVLVQLALVGGPAWGEGELDSF